jgi:lysophospholipase-2
MAQWFDLQTTSDLHREPERQIEGLTLSAARINTLIDEELRTIPASNIILGGMSQGYATAANVLMTRPRALGGFIGISGWLPWSPS